MTIIQPESRKIENKILENPTQMQDLSINRNCDVSKTWINKKEENSVNISTGYKNVKRG